MSHIQNPGGSGGGSGTPGGSDTQVQFNDAGSLGGDAGLTYDKTSNHLALGSGTIDIDPDGNPASILLNLKETVTVTTDSYGISQSMTLNPTGNTAGFFYGHSLGLKTLAANVRDFSGALYGVYGFINHESDGNIAGDGAYGTVGDVNNSGSGTIGKAYGLWANVNNLGTGTITERFGVYVSPPLNAGGGTIGTSYGLWIDDQAVTGGTTDYGIWYNGVGIGQGVWRLKSDGVVAYYNPTFASYTPDTANFERIVTQWNTNVAEIGTEAGGTGTLRALRLLGSGYKLAALTSNGFVKTSSGDGTLSVDTATYQTALTDSASLRAALSDENGTGAALFSSNTSATFITPAITTSATLTRNTIGATPTDGFVIQNTEPALTGAQQFSPRLVFAGQAFKSNATSASQASLWAIDNQTTQGTTAGGGTLTLSHSIAGGAYSKQFEFIASASSTPTSYFRITSPGAGSSGFELWVNNFGTYLGGLSGSSVSNAILNIGGSAQGISRSGAGALETNNGTAGQWIPLFVGKRDAGTTTVTDGLTIGHQSTGTPAAGLGSALLFNINSSTTADQNAAQISALWTDATHASRSADIVFKAVNNAGALAEVGRLTGLGVFNAIKYKVNGTAGANFGPGLPTSVTVVDGIVTAIS